MAECTKKHVVFADMRPDPVVFQWDAGAAPVAVPAGMNTFNTTVTFAFLPRDVPNDPKGFFAVRTNITTGAGAVVRYSYK
ncbi:hypothetical protein GX586_09580 [bacterium]|nr:hypothetical protein [bacterium]